MKINYNLYIKSPEWQIKREEAFATYGRRCNTCNGIHNLHVHHLTYERLGNELVSDLQVLCEECHYKLHEQHQPRFKKRKRIKMREMRVKKTPNPKQMAYRAAKTKRWIRANLEEAVGIYNISGVEGLRLRFKKNKARTLIHSTTFKNKIGKIAAKKLKPI